MGYDIYYVPYDENEFNSYKSSEDIDTSCSEYESYLSYNFSGMSLCGKNFRDYLYLPDIAGQKTETIIPILEEVLERLKREGYRGYIPPETWKHEWNGKVEVKRMDGWTPDMRVFMYHVQRLLKECKQHDDCVVVLDSPQHPLRLQNLPPVLIKTKMDNGDYEYRIIPYSELGDQYYIDDPKLIKKFRALFMSNTVRTCVDLS